MKYPYPRVDITGRISGELLDIIHEAGFRGHYSLTDAITWALLVAFDRDGSCPDWDTISPTLSGRPPKNAPQLPWSMRARYKSGSSLLPGRD